MDAISTKANIQWNELKEKKANKQRVKEHRDRK